MNERPSLVDYASKVSEESIRKERENRTIEIASILIKNPGYIGGKMEDEESQVVGQNILGVFRANYDSVDHMEKIAKGIIPNGTDRQTKLARENLKILGDAGVVALNYLYRGYQNEGLPLDGQDAAGLDPLFASTPLDGVGKFIVTRNAFFVDNEDRDSFLKLLRAVDGDRRVFFQLLGAKNGDGEYTKLLKRTIATLSPFSKAINSDAFSKGDSETMDGDGLLGTEDNYSPPVQLTDQLDNGKRNEDGRNVESRPWELGPKEMADAMLDMDYQMNFNSRTPPSWFKSLKLSDLGMSGTKKDLEAAKGKIIIMSMVNDAASWLKGSGKDFDKIMGSRTAFAFTHEYMNTLLDADSKLALSKMLQDLCEFYVDQNGVRSLRYKEKFYDYDYKAKDGRGDFITETVIVDGEEKRVRRTTYKDTPENRDKGVRTIDFDVFSKLNKREDYLNEIAAVVAKSHNRDVPNYMDRMTAYSAWNLWFAMGGSSMADRMRILPTWDGIMSDALRTLNPEYKALSKWQILKSGKLRRDDNLFDAEYFSGPIADYVISVMRLERDIGRAIDGKKTLREKIVDGDVRIFPDKTFYSFFDFVNGSRDLQLAEGSSTSIGELIFNYVKFDRDGYKINGTEKDFSFKPGQTTYLNEWRDSLEAAVLAYKTIMNKTEAKTIADLSLTLKDKFGMANGIEFGGGLKPFMYTSSPDFWARAIQATLKPNMKWFSSDFIPIIKPMPKSGVPLDYDMYVSRLVRSGLNIDTMNINVDRVVKMLGVTSYNGGLETPETASLFKLIKNQISNETKGIQRTFDLKNEQANKLRERGDDEKIISMKSDYERLKSLSTDYDYQYMTSSLKRSLEMGNVGVSENLLNEIKSYLVENS